MASIKSVQSVLARECTKFFLGRYRIGSETSIVRSVAEWKVVAMGIPISYTMGLMTDPRPEILEPSFRRNQSSGWLISSDRALVGFRLETLRNDIDSLTDREFYQ